MMSPQVLISGLLLLLSAAVDSFPEEHGVVGQPVTLSCAYPVSNGLASLCWGRGACASDTCGQTLVWTDGNRINYRTSSRYQINAQLLQGNASLTIEDAYESDSGLYCCRVEMKGWDGVQTLTTSLQVQPGVPTSSSRRLTISSRFKPINRPGPTLTRPETITKPPPTSRRPSITIRPITTPRRPTTTPRKPKTTIIPNIPRRPTPPIKPIPTPNIPSTTTKSTTITRFSTTIKPTTPERFPRTTNPTTTRRTSLTTIKLTTILRTPSTTLKSTTTPRKPATTITTLTTSWKPETAPKFIITSSRPTTTTKHTTASTGPTNSPKSTRIPASTSPTLMHMKTQQSVWTATVTSSNQPWNNHTEVVPTETPLKIPIRGLLIGISVSASLLILASIPTIIQCRHREKKKPESNSECSSVFFHAYQNEGFQNIVQLQAEDIVYVIEDHFHPRIKSQLPFEMTTFQSCRRK